MEPCVADKADNSAAGMAKQAVARVVRFIDANQKVGWDKFWGKLIFFIIHRMWCGLA